MAYRPEGDPTIGAHVPFPPMPPAWRVPGTPPGVPRTVRPATPAPRPATAVPRPATPAPAPPPRTASPPPRIASPPRAAALRPLSPIAYPGLPVSAPVPVKPPVSDPFTGEELSSRSTTIAGLLQIFLGGAGAGRFYTGHVAMALAQIAVAWIVLGTFVCAGFLLVVPWLFAWVGFLWPVVDGIVLLTGARQRDAEGRLLRP